MEPPGARLSPSDEAAAKAYFAALLDAWVAAHPEKRDAPTPPTIEELLSFAEANEEVGLRAMMSIASAVPEGEAAPGATLAAAARAAGLRAPPAQPPAAELVPEPCFVVKTRDEGGRKVFVNVCCSARVAAPGDWASGQARPSCFFQSGTPRADVARQVPLAVKEALEAEAAGAAPGAAPPEALRFPLACGPPRTARDAEGAPATVVDVVYAEKVAAAAASDARLKAFLIGLALAHVGAKHNMTLDARYKLPRRRYMDEPVRPQRVRDDAAGPRIRELNPGTKTEPEAKPSTPVEAPPKRPAAAASPLFAKPAAPKAAAAAPAVAAGAAFSVEFEGRPCAALLCRVPLPPALADAARAGGAPPVRLALSRGTLALHAMSAGGAACGAPLAATPLPFEVDPSRAAAWLEQQPSCGHVALVARLPVRPYGDAARDAATRPANGAIDLASARYLELID